MASSVEKLIVFGATGNVGLTVTEMAVKKGFQVTAFIRDADKLPAELKEQVKVVVGDVLNKDAVTAAVKGHDAVIVTLGTRTDLGPTTILSEGTKNIVSAMKEHEVRKISVCISAFLFSDMKDVPIRYHEITADHVRQADVLNQSELDWVAVCPPHITNDPPTGSYRVVIESSFGRSISKFDLADLLLKCLDSSDYINHKIGLGYEQA